jgi:CrcB protein
MRGDFIAFILSAALLKNNHPWRFLVLTFQSTLFILSTSLRMSVLSFLIKHPWTMAATGGAVGAVARVIVSTGVARWTGEEFPFGTIVVNVTGALIMGMLAGYGQSEPGKLVFSEPARTFLMIGVLGGYTTFSSFSLQTFLLLEQGNLLGASLNVVLSVLLCIAGIWAGFAAIRLFV